MSPPPHIVILNHHICHSEGRMTEESPHHNALSPYCHHNLICHPACPVKRSEIGEGSVATKDRLRPKLFLTRFFVASSSRITRLPYVILEGRMTEGSCQTNAQTPTRFFGTQPFSSRSYCSSVCPSE